jgi:hypothetical protein
LPNHPSGKSFPRTKPSSQRTHPDEKKKTDNSQSFRRFRREPNFEVISANFCRRLVPLEKGGLKTDKQLTSLGTELACLARWNGIHPPRKPEVESEIVFALETTKSSRSAGELGDLA